MVVREGLSPLLETDVRRCLVAIFLASALDVASAAEAVTTPADQPAAKTDQHAAQMQKWRAERERQAAESKRLEAKVHGALDALDTLPVSARGPDPIARLAPVVEMMRAYYAADARRKMLDGFLLVMGGRPSPELAQIWFKAQLYNLAEFDAETKAAIREAPTPADPLERLEREQLIAGTREGALRQLTVLLDDLRAYYADVAPAARWQSLATQLQVADRR